MNTINIVSKLNKDEYIRASRILMRRLYGLSLILLCIFVPQTIVLSALLAAGGSHFGIFVLVFSGLVSLFVVYIYFVFPSSYYKKLVKTGDAVNSVNITPNYFESSHPMIGKLPWSNFLELWTSNEFYFLIGHKKGIRQMAYFLPKRCFSEPEEMQAFENFARDGIKKVVELKR